MRSSKNNLDIDFIGGGAPITKAEELEISRYIKSISSRRTKIQKKSSSKLMCAGIRVKKLKLA